MSTFIEVHNPKLNEHKRLINADAISRIDENPGNATTQIFLVGDPLPLPCLLTYRTLKGRLAKATDNTNTEDNSNQDNSESEGV